MNADSGLLVAIGEEIRTKLDEPTTINVAVFGPSGSGKSTLIQSLLGVEVSSNAGVEPTPYQSTKHGAIVTLWEMPDSKFDSSQQFDVVILTFNGEFATASSLASEIMAKKGDKTAIYYVKTKGEQHVAKEDIFQQLPDNHGGAAFRLFVVDLEKRKKFDFEALRKTLLTDLSFVKRKERLAFLATDGRNQITKIVASFQDRIFNAAMWSSAASIGFPVPYLSLGVDCVVIARELFAYQRKIGLDDASLKRFASALYSDNSERLTKIVGDEWFDTFSLTLAAGLVKEILLKKMSRKLLAIYTTATYLPAVGNLSAAALSYFATRYVLRDFLGNMEKMALDVLDSCMTHETDKLLSGEEN